MKKRILSFLLAFIMLVGMLPVTAMAADSHTITTGDTYGTSMTNANVISECVITGAAITNSTVSDDCLTWDVYMPAGTDTSAELSYTIFVVNNKSRSMAKLAQASFNGGSYEKLSKDSINVYKTTFSGVPDWKDGSATVTFAVAYNGSSKYARTYTMKLHIDDGKNDAPVLTGDSAAAKTLRVKDTYELDLTGIFEDRDSQGLSYSVSINEAAPVIADASFQYVPETTGTHTLVFTASDGELTSEAYTVTLTVNENVAPGLAGEASLAETAIQDQAWKLDLGKVFADEEGDALTYTVAIDGAEAVAADADYSYIPTEVRDYTLVFQATDIRGDVSPTYTVTLTVTANPGPVLVDGSELSADAMHGLPWTLDLNKVFVDNEGDPITYAVSVNDAAAVSAAANYSYTPTAAGTDTLVFQAADGKGAASPVYTVTLNVAENPVPKLTGDASANASVDQYKTWNINLEPLFADNDGDSLTYSVSVDGAAAVSANANYSYAANTSGEKTFAFYATDLAGNVSPAYTVTLTTNYVPRTAIATGCVEQSGKAFDAWVGTITVTGPVITEYQWVGGNGHDETSDGAHVLNILLDPATADDATITLTYTLGGNTGQGTVSGTTSLTLENGTGVAKATSKAKSIASWAQTRNYTINFTNKANSAPVVLEGAQTTGSVPVYDTWTLDVSTLFADADGNNTLTYSLAESTAGSLDGTVYSWAPDTAGSYELTFIATDIWQASASHTVTLTVKAATEYIPVSGVTLSESAVSLCTGDTTELTATIEPYNAATQDVKWTSSNEAVATVDENGVVTAVSAGTATITVMTTETEYENFSASCEVTVRYPVTIIAPAGSIVSIGSLNGSYAYYFATALSVVTDETAGTITYGFNLPTTAGNKFIRVQHPEGVTYWDYKTSLTKGCVVTIPEDKLHLNDDSFNANTVYRNFEQYKFDLGDIYMNINAKGYINLAKGGTKQLYMFRNWQAVESISNAKIALPDFSYEIINIDGSDVITIEPDANNSAVATLTAKNEGTAIVLVTYDAMFSEMVLTNAMGGSGGPARLSAIWPDRTGVFVVSVGKDGSAIQTNMTCNGATFDAEHNPLFYTGSEGASFSFKPEDGCKVTVNRGTVGAETLSFGSFVSDGVTVADDGTVTVSGLTTGRHIIRVEKDGLYTYQVVTATKVTVAVTDVHGKAVTATNPVKPGETVTVSFTGLTNPAEKMATAYNFSPIVRYVGADGTAYTSSSDGGIGSYNFSAGTHKITVTIPGDWNQSTFVVDQGCITLGGMGGTTLGGHRNYNYNTSKGMGSGSAVSAKLAQMPVISIDVDVDNTIPVASVTITPAAAEVEEGKTVALLAEVLPADATVQTVIWTSSDGTIATVDENGVVTGVKAGNATITAEAGGKSAQCAVTVTAKPVVNVTGISLNTNQAELKVGKTLTLNAAVTPDNATDKTVIWTSSNEQVATVSGGSVTAVAEGTATITAAAGGFSATCEVTVAKEQETDSTATVYFSVSDDAQFLKTDKNFVIAMQKLDVPYFDLALYGLEEYKTAEEKPTMLHLYLYATEIFLCGVDTEDAGKGYLYENGLLGTDLLTVSGSAGSIFMEKFWNMSLNLNYYHNYAYPADSTGYGITADRVVLSDGDIVTIGHFTSWSFFSDPSSIFNYIVADGKTVTTSAAQDQTLTLNVYRAGADMGGGGTNTPVTAVRDIYYVKTDALTSGDVTTWTKLGTTDASGQLKVNLLGVAPGQYIVATAGQYGTEYPQDIVSTPGGIVLNVLESETSKQVKTVINLIDGIGEVTLDSEAAIIAARNAYDALTEDQQAAVTNFDKLTDAEAKLSQLKQAKADQDAADAVTEKINAIGTVTPDSKDAIDAARAAYDALTDAQKALISEETRKKLIDAEKAYADLIADEADKTAAKAVEEKIAAIDTVTLDSEQKITAARQAFNALTDTQKQLVGNYDVLTAAEKKLAQLKDEAAADAVEEKITAISTVTLDSEEKIKAARAAYDALTDTQKALVENLAVLEAAEEALELLKLAGTDITNIYKTTGDYLEGLTAPTVGTTNGEWRVIGLARAGKSVAEGYYNAVVKYVQENMDENGRLHESTSTEYSRLIVALTAIGKDVTDVEGYNLLSGLNDMAYIGKQGINGTIWALIAFDTHDYEIPTGDVTREKLVQTIVGKQCADGGWSLNGVAGDPDITGMALQALAPYYQTNSSVQTAVDKALAWLSGIQSKDGTFTCSEGVTSESLAQVITGLTALGLNPETDSRFIKNGVSAVDALSQFYVEGGGFKHGLTGDRNMMATEQAFYALVSYYRMLQGKTSLYDMSDVTIVIPVYKIIEGANSDWQKDDDALTIRADGEFAKFTGVKMDGKLVDSKHYTAKAGSTVITFAADYLKTLSEGEHTVTVVFKDGEAATSLSILPTDEEAASRVEELIKEIGTVTKDSEKKIKAAKEAYDKLTEEQKKLVDNYKVLTEAEEKLDSLKETITVTFTLLGDSIHGDTATPHTLSGGGLSTWIGATSIDVKAPATVLDVLTLALKGKYSFRNDGGNYISSINGLAEFTNGGNSGWMYTLNGIHPGLGVAEQTVKNGDVIVFHYTDDYTKEESSQGFGDRDKAAAEKVEELIDAIGTVTLDSKDKIDAARKAYDALTYTQKQLVDNYATLTAAESKYAQLKKDADEAAAKKVEDMIDALDSNSATFEDDVKAAKKAYNALTADQKKLAGNYQKLADALKKLASEEDKKAAEAVEKLIDAIGTVTKDSEAAIKAAREAYDKLTDEQKALVGNLAILEAAEEKLAALKTLVGIEDIYKATGDYLEKLGTPVPGTVGGEWMVIGLIRSGREVPDAYYDNAVKFVQENIDENGRLHSAKSTENARMILALTAIGKDVTNVGGHNLLSGLTDMAYVQKQGINGPIWALIAFDSGNYPIPEGGDVTREALIQVILDAQLSDGGWALSGSTSDADITGMALQALAPYYKTDAKVRAAVDEALETLSVMQTADGSFGSIDGVSAESIAQVVAGLSALGIDAHTDARFVKNGLSAIDALCAFYVEGGGFKHIPGGSLDGMATEQSYYALAAYFRMLEGKTALYDMTDVIDMGGDVTVEEPVETLPAETESAPTEPVETPEKEGRSFLWWLVIVIVVLAGAIVVLVIISKPKKGNHMK